MEAASIDGLVAHCQKAQFTGILRVRAREGIGEVWFLSGIADEVHFGTSNADEAMDRMRSATQAMYELVTRLPHPAGGFKRSFPVKGSVASVTLATLMRYCERYSLTCTLEIQSKDVLIEAKYELGELVSVETTADDDGITSMLEAKEGTYEFKLPYVELPPDTPVLPPSSLRESMAPESLGISALLEAKAGRPVSDEAEVKRKTVEIARQQKVGAPAKKVESAAKKEEPKPVESKPVAAKPVESAAKKEEAKPVEAKPVAAAAKPVESAAKKEEAKPVEAKPVAAAAKPVESAAKKEEAKPVEATPVAAAPKPVEAAAKKDDAKPVESAAKKEEPKPVETAAKKDGEEPAEADAAAAKDDDAPKSDDPPAKPAAPKKRRAKSEEKAPAPPPPAKRSMAWLVVPLLLAVAVAYLYWTHRI